MRFHKIALLVLAFALGGCEIPGLGDSAKVAEAKEADGRAIGGACRHSGRALEDCYVMNPKALRSAVYAGWRDMDGYMRDNDIKPVVPDLVDPPTGGVVQKPAPAKGADDAEKKGGVKRSLAPMAPEPPLPRRST
ncbi:MAG: hypothetical protein KJ634_03220 [Gammaproteobacteria bacterium]|nr:hypothetical protein [Gammaproteobacteria bacterium]MBU1414613.1 hypothetical protein [Gammaproteobacteria bacterium]